jgi:hypothetical protein
MLKNVGTLALVLAGLGAVPAASLSCDHCRRGSLHRTQQADNKYCPMTGKLADPNCTVRWRGHRLGFCCSRCRADFEKLCDSHKAEKARRVLR